MQWFFAPSQSGKRARRKSKSTPTVKISFDWLTSDTTKRRAQIAFAVITFVGLGVAWYYGEKKLTQYVAQTQRVPSSPAGVVLVDAPSWMSQLLHSDITSEVAAQFSSDPLDQFGVQRAVSTLQRNPWVRQVHRVHRGAEGMVQVQAEFRQPVAVVAGPDGYHIVDYEGIRLPGLYVESQLEMLGLPVIVGASHAPRRVGEAWPGDDVQAGLTLSHLLRDEPYMQQVKAFDVSARDSRGRIRLLLRTDDGLVIWGLPPGQEQAIEPDAATKKRGLLAAYHKYNGSVDAHGKIVNLLGPFRVEQPDRAANTTRASYTH